MRLVSLSAGLELEPRTSPPVLLRRKGTRLVRGADRAALASIIRTYLALLGPATPVDVAGYLGARGVDIKDVWPDELVEVTVGSSRTWLPSEHVAACEAPPEPDQVRLRGGNDPYLQARDRALLVPDKGLYKQLWPVLGKPGVVFAEGEVAGTWRASAKGTKLTLAVTEFAPLPPPVWAAVQREAERVAAVRELTLAKVTRA